MQKKNLLGMDWDIQSEGFSCELEEIQAGGIALAKAVLSAGTPAVPHRITLSFHIPSLDIFSIWSPLRGMERMLKPNWLPARSSSRIAAGAPVLSLISKAGQNRLTVALSDAATATEISAGVSEETAEFQINVTLFTELTHAIDRYEVFIRLDTRDVGYGDALSGVEAWWEEFYPPCSVPENAREPLFSSWYNFHQELSADELVRQCSLAAELGMKTLIIDDGWQTEDNSRGYAYCGDWKLAVSKIPDMARLSSEIHRLGMKIMIWYSVPFVGIHSANFPRFAGKYLNDPLETGYGILDPRFAECREFLADTYAGAVEAWDLDGLKLDFIDSFELSGFASDKYEDMDCISLEEGISRLLHELGQVLKSRKPDFLIEFRQRYIGPVVRQLGNMLRVNDCPNCSLSNRLGGIDLRLLSGKTDVHSDMVMWHTGDTAASAAHQLIASLYSVPQISMMLDRLPPEHKKMLAFYLRFWRENREVLLDGYLTAKNPEAGYSLVRADLGDRAVITPFSRCDVALGSARTGAVVNGTDEDYLYIEAPHDFRYQMHTCTGEAAEAGEKAAGVSRLAVPKSGMLSFTRL